MSAWGHALRRLTAEETADGKWGPPHCSAGGRPRCVERAAFAFTYRYITGRAGRVSWAEKWLCQAHAARTAKRYTLELPAEAAEGARHASARAVEQLLGDKS